MKECVFCNIVKESRDDELYECNKIFEDIIPNVYNSGFKGIYVIASNPLDVMCRMFALSSRLFQKFKEKWISRRR